MNLGVANGDARSRLQAEVEHTRGNGVWVMVTRCSILCLRKQLLLLFSVLDS